MSRDQRRARVHTVDSATGATTVVREDTDDAWVAVVDGVPDWLGDGRLVWVVDSGDARRLALGDELVTPPDLQVEGVLHVDDDAVLVEATDEPSERHVVRVGADGSVQRLTTEPGLHYAVAGGDIRVVVSASLDDAGSRAVVWAGDRELATIGSRAARPSLVPQVELLLAGERALRTVVLLPTDRDAVAGPLPVLLDPYGGPHASRVLKARGAFLTSQWLADQGFAVVVADGRGTPARGPAWERAVAGDLATPALDDQVAALEDVGKRYGDVIDLERVAIRGWSFGGFLAALAVLRRPDVFHAAIAGAPVTDWRLYDTFYTERYLGHPDEQPAAYERSSLLADAPALRRPLLLVHGLADDNVVAAHTLRLSAALLAAGRPHTVLPLSGVTHMTPQEVVAENLLVLQVAFLREALRSPAVS
jgi:dipeptidyl-peptidase-4